MAAGDALELALGLWRAPARRTLLAGRPLPGGMTSLLAVAAGSRAALQEAAARTGADVDELQEAARFFVQQVMLVDGADAYRTLGASPDAPQAQLQGHFRLLQRWLHPDRDTGDAWDSAFASRVNAAWARVRNPRLRRAYDDEPAAPGVGGVAPTYGHPAYPANHAAGIHANRGPAAPANPAPDIPAGRGHAADAPPATNAWFARPATIVAVIALVGLGFAWHAFWPDALPPPVQPATAQSPAIILAAAESPGAAMAPEPIPDVSAIEAALADPLPDLLEPVAPGVPRTPTPPPMPVTRSASSTPPATPTASAAPTMPGAPATQNVGGVAPTYDAAQTPPPAPADDIAQTPPPAPADDVAQTPPTGPADDIAQTAPTPGAEDPLVLFEEAEHTVARLTDWLAAGSGRPPPIWNDSHTEAAAATARDDLHARREGRRPGRLAIDSPRWQLGDERAALTGDYRFGTRRNAEGGRLQVQLVRREQRWLVSAVHMEPSP